MHFKWKSKFGHYDPKWPQVNIWPHNIGISLNLMNMCESYGYAMYHGRVIAF